MHKLSNKAQFFILTTVIIVGVFFTLSKYINEYSFIDTSKAAEGAEVFMFENIKGKAIKTVKLSNITTFETTVSEYKDFVEDMVAERGYSLILNYNNISNIVYFNMTLMSEKYVLKSEFSQRSPNSRCDSECMMSDYYEGVCEQNPTGQCANKGGVWREEWDVYCTGGEDEDTCCCFP